jgi:hypothetical protein
MSREVHGQNWPKGDAIAIAPSPSIADWKGPRTGIGMGMGSTPPQSLQVDFYISIPSDSPLTLTPMVAAKSVPQKHLADPFEAALRPPPGETPAQRDARILAEHLAKQVSDAIDEQLRVERAELKKSSPDVRILLLGQSESGKSTTLKRTYSISHCRSHMSFDVRVFRSLPANLRIHSPLFSCSLISQSSSSSTHLLLSRPSE